MLHRFATATKWLFRIRTRRRFLTKQFGRALYLGSNLPNLHISQFASDHPLFIGENQYIRPPKSARM
jgi:hypothetical protein